MANVSLWSLLEDGQQQVPSSVQVNFVENNTMNNETHNLTFENLIEENREAVFIDIIVYSICFVVGSVSNCWVFYRLSLKINKSRVNYLIRHLTFADMMVVFFAILPDLIWKISITWEVGAFLCKMMNTMKAFTLYLSSNIIVCMSVDRFYAFVRPMHGRDYVTRNNKYLLISYVLSFLCALPQVSVTFATHRN